MSKTDHVVLARRRREAIVNLEIIKQRQRSCHLFEFFILTSNILQCFCRLKFEKKLYFFSFIFRSKMIVHTAEKVKYFALR